MSKITSKTAGVMVVHLAGLICPQMDQLQKICSERGLFLIEDAAQSHGTTFNGRKAGSLGDAGCFSFYPTKPMTTGEGGMIVSDNADLAKFALSVRNHGMDESGLYDKLGYNWRMSELNAIVGIRQLKRLDQNIEERNRVAKRYRQGLAEVSGVEPIPVPDEIRHSYYKFPVLIDEKIDPQAVHATLRREHRIATGALYYPPIHMQPYYERQHGYRPDDLPVAKRLLARQVCLPMFVGLEAGDVDYVVNSLKKCLA